MTKSRDDNEVTKELIERMHSGSLTRRHWKDLRTSVKTLSELFSLRHLPAMSRADVDTFLKEKVLNQRRPKLVCAPSKELEKLKSIYHVPKRQKIEHRVLSGHELFVAPQPAARLTPSIHAAKVTFDRRSISPHRPSKPDSFQTVKHERKDALVTTPSGARISRYIGRTKTQANTGSGETQTFPAEPLCSYASSSSDSYFEEPLPQRGPLFSMTPSAQFLQPVDSSSANQVGKVIPSLIGYSGDGNRMSHGKKSASSRSGSNMRVDQYAGSSG